MSHTRQRVMIDADSLRSETKDNSIKVIDVRRKEDYNKSHVPTAVNLPLADLLSDDSPQRVGKIFGSLGISDETPVAIYDDTFGALASRVAWTLEYLGHKGVSLLDVTYSGWRSMELEVNDKTPDIQPKSHSVRLRQDIIASADYLESAIQQDNTLLIDNRERLNYLEQHIGGAINIPYRSLASPEKIIRPKDEMVRLFDNRGVRPGSEIITYCGSVGTLSGLAYYALKSAGMSDVRLYVRSFKEWKNLEKPVERQEHANYWDLSAE